MSFRIRWRATAVQALGAAYMTARPLGLGPAVTAATDRAERLLANAPGEVGESRSGTRRVTFVGPLVIEFSIRAADRIVVIQSVRFAPPAN